MKKNLFNLFAILCLSLTMASCVDNEDPKQYLMGQFVIEGINPNYTLYAREGYVVHLDPTSVTSLTGAKGFGDNRRGYFQVNFNPDETEIKQAPTGNKNIMVIKNAELVAGEYVKVQSPMTWKVAESKNITVADSIFDVKKLGECWVHRGFLNIIHESYYSLNSNREGIFPTTSVVYKQESVKDNEITLDILYNRHTSKDASTSPATANFITAYDFNLLAQIVPGKDSIKVTLQTEGTDEKKVLKVGRDCNQY